MVSLSCDIDTIPTARTCFRRGSSYPKQILSRQINVSREHAANNLCKHYVIQLGVYFLLSLASLTNFTGTDQSSLWVMLLCFL